MQSIVSKGKNIKEAIQFGLDLMEVSKQDVNIEILQKESKGFMGIGCKEAVVKLSKNKPQDDYVYTTDQNNTTENFTSIEDFVESFVTENNEEEPIEKSTESRSFSEDIGGKVWVEKGIIHVRDFPGKHPTVNVNDGVYLYKNNRPVKEQTVVVLESDFLSTRFPKEEQETRWKITLDKAKLKAILELEPGYKVIRKLQDIPPSEHIQLFVEETKQDMNTLEYDEILNEMAVQNILYGKNQTEIMNAISATEPGNFEIATGKEPKQGENGSIELKVAIDMKNVLKEDDSGNVNFRESRIIPTVDKGEILGIIYPPVQGTPGMSVTNTLIEPRPVYPLTIKAEKGVILVENKIIATEPGRPAIQKRGLLIKASVLPRMVQEGNVNIASGNIHFYGDVEILGEVEENMNVESGGDIIVNKSVNEATLTAANSIVTYGNVSGSVLTAGKNSMIIVELGQLLGIMQSQIETMIAVINQLVNAPAFKSSDFARGGLQPLIRILLEKKFNNFFELAKRYVDLANKEKDFLEMDWKMVSHTINQYFLRLSDQVKTVHQIKDLSLKMKDLYESSKTPTEPGSYLTISNAANSSLYCSGNILVIGHGSINTKIYAGGQLKITGILRGGEVFGKLGAELNEVGSSSGTKTIVAAAPDKKIRINKAFEGTVLKFGNKTFTLEDTKKDIVARLTKDEQIVLY